MSTSENTIGVPDETIKLISEITDFSEPLKPNANIESFPELITNSNLEEEEPTTENINTDEIPEEINRSANYNEVGKLDDINTSGPTPEIVEGDEDNEGEEELKLVQEEESEPELVEEGEEGEEGETENNKKENDEEQINEEPEEVNNENNEEDKLLEGGGLNDIEYKIDYLVEDDEKLIIPDKVFKRVGEYISNYNSDKMKEYNQAFKNIYQKYSNRKYSIVIMESESNAPKIVVMRSDNKKDIITEIRKPLYYFYNKNNGLEKMKQNISNLRNELQYEYEKLKGKLDLTPEEKKQFEKRRKKFIEYLENYYTYTLYHKKINNITSENKVPLIIQEVSGFYKENIEDQKPILFGNIYSIDKGLIDNVNKINIDKLTKFNDIMLKLGGKKKDIAKDKKMIEEIKEYLNKNEINKNIENINKMAKQQSEYIDYVIKSLPVVD